MGPFYEFNFNPSMDKCTCNCIHYKVRDEIVYPFSHFNSAAIGVPQNRDNLKSQVDHQK